MADSIFSLYETGPELALSRWGQWALGCALALTTATRFRLPGLPLGVGEVLLLALMCSGPCVLAARRGLGTAPRASRNMALVWGALFLCLGAGALGGHAQGVLVPHAAVREAAALGFCALYTVWLGTLRWDQESMQRVFVVCALIVLLVNSVLVLHEFVAFKYYKCVEEYAWVSLLKGAKIFSGWTTNINQTILPLVVAIPLCAAQAWSFFRDDCFRTKGCCLASAVVLMFAFGILVFSRSFIVFALALAGFVTLYALAPAPRARALVNRLFVFFIAAATLSYGAAAAYAVATQGAAVGAARHILLLNGLKALRTSLGLGFGPGAYSGLYQPFEGMEVHNLFVDTALMGGVAGALVLAGLFAHSARAVMRLPQKRWLCVWGGMFIMVMLHNLLRHPIFWTALLCPLLLDGWGQKTAAGPPPAGRA